MKSAGATVKNAESNSVKSSSYGERLTWIWLWTLSLVGPSFYTIYRLKTLRIYSLKQHFGIPHKLWFYLSDALSLASWWLFTFSVLYYYSSRMVRRLLQVGTACYLLYLNFAHTFYATTGTTLPLRVIVDSLERFEEVSVVVSATAERSRTPLFLVGFSLCGSLLLPLVVEWLARRYPNFLSGALTSVIKKLSGPLKRFQLSIPRPAISIAIAFAVWLVSTISIPAFSKRSDLACEPLANMCFRLADSAIESKGRSKPLDRPLGAQKALRATKQANRLNVVVLMLESTGAWATLGDEFPSASPFLRSWANNAQISRKYRIVIPHTSKALVATLCGIEPHPSFEITESREGGLPGRCLASLLKEQGYDTAFFQGAMGEFERREVLVKNMGYAEFHPADEIPEDENADWEKANYFGLEDGVLLKPIGDWLDARSDSKPFFMTLLTNTPHHQYLAPKRYGREQYVLRNHRKDAYLNAIHYQDEFLRLLAQKFAERGMEKNTIFVIAGDHGEGFGEHERWAHDDVIYEEGSVVPLVISYPEELKRDVPPRDFFDSQLDVTPTVLQLLGYEFSKQDFAGRSMLEEEDRERLHFSFCYHERTCSAVVHQNSKYIFHFGIKPDERFDLAMDPSEKRSLALGADIESRRKILSWRDGVRELYGTIADKDDQ